MATPPDQARMGVTIIIPARMASTRFPGKVLADRTGKPLIQHVVERARRAGCGSRVVIATDDARVCDAAGRFGAECVMTRANHPNGTSRLAEAAAVLGLGGDAVVVNVQGDEPEVEPSLIDAAVEVLERTGAPVSTAAVPFGADEDPADPNVVKVVAAADGTALYFSRARIPFERDAGHGRVRPLKHLGLYAYRRSFLDEYLRLPCTDLEVTEQLEQLRILYHGRKIAVAVRDVRTFGGIDTPAQYEAFVARWESEGGR